MDRQALLIFNYYRYVCVLKYRLNNQYRQAIKIMHPPACHQHVFVMILLITIEKLYYI